jgi:integrase/recombinase XerD
MTEIPPEGLLPNRHKRAKPYLYSDEQIHQILDAARNMPTTHSLQPWTHHCLFGLLAVTGLRIGEALNLRSTDVDWSEGILTIRDAKFGKSRLIPLHTSSLKVLADYAARRDRLFAVRKTPYFFCSRYDGRLDEGQVRRVFYTISIFRLSSAPRSGAELAWGQRVARLASSRLSECCGSAYCWDWSPAWRSRPSSG